MKPRVGYRLICEKMGGGWRKANQKTVSTGWLGTRTRTGLGLFELSHAEPPASGKKKIRLQVQTLFEVEPEVQHILVDRTQDVVATRIVRSSEKVTELEF